MGIEGIWIAYPSTFCPMFVLQMAYYRLVWRNRSIKCLTCAAGQSQYYDHHRYNRCMPHLRQMRQKRG